MAGRESPFLRYFSRGTFERDLDLVARKNVHILGHSGALLYGLTMMKEILYTHTENPENPEVCITSS